MEWNAEVDPTVANTLEILNSPANPTGELRVPRNGSMLICDFVYDWPYLRLGATQRQRCDVMIYSMSKLTGHAGSRFGWALVKDKALYDMAVDIMLDLTLGISVDAQVRTNTVLRHVISEHGQFFTEGRSILENRWDRLEGILKECLAGVSLANTKSRGPNAWFATPEGTNATATLLKGGLLGWGGSDFGAGHNTVRFSLLDSNSTMELIFDHLTELCKHPADEMLVLVTPGVNNSGGSGPRRRKSLPHF